MLWIPFHLCAQRTSKSRQKTVSPESHFRYLPVRSIKDGRATAGAADSPSVRHIAFSSLSLDCQLKSSASATVATVATPINFVLLALLLLLAYYRLRPAAPVALPKGPPPVVFQTYTPRTLLKNNGENGKPVYLAVRGKVYDVSPGKNFYGPGGPYENFAGRDATRGLAYQSFDEDVLTKDLDGPLDDCKDLNKDQTENLNGWIERFDEKVRPA